ncbi:hypothetical protein EDC04DRAFT_2870965 [Pisolithus marmoratus]|nr:hypothetical protein EDC04DRAFT_2870965 [Pisolithus marmoratus]
MSATLDYASLEKSRWKNLAPPPGFSNQPTSNRPYAALKEKRAWDLAISPAKSLPMQGIHAYMSGGGVPIFSMGIVFMLLLTPFKSIAGMNADIYMACNLLTLAVGLWKCRSMGLLPNRHRDWLAFETRAPEISL